MVCTELFKNAANLSNDPKVRIIYGYKKGEAQIRVCSNYSKSETKEKLHLSQNKNLKSYNHISLDGLKNEKQLKEQGSSNTPEVQTLCSNSCEYADDGACDDGGTGSEVGAYKCARERWVYLLSFCCSTMNAVLERTVKTAKKDLQTAARVPVSVLAVLQLILRPVVP